MPNSSGISGIDMMRLGYPVPKGVPVIMLTSYAQRSAYKAVSEGIEGTRHESSHRNGRRYSYWADDDHAEFKPERWLTTDGVFNLMAGPWMLFSFGFRGCLGQKLAILELCMFLALIKATFFLDKVPEELDSFAARETITTHPTQCYVNPILWSEIGSDI